MVLNFFKMQFYLYVYIYVVFELINDLLAS